MSSGKLFNLIFDFIFLDLKISNEGFSLTVEFILYYISKMMCITFNFFKRVMLCSAVTVEWSHWKSSKIFSCLTIDCVIVVVCFHFMCVHLYNVGTGCFSQSLPCCTVMFQLGMYMNTRVCSTRLGCQYSLIDADNVRVFIWSLHSDAFVTCLWPISC